VALAKECQSFLTQAQVLNAAFGRKEYIKRGTSKGLRTVPGSRETLTRSSAAILEFKCRIAWTCFSRTLRSATLPEWCIRVSLYQPVEGNARRTV
jgi:hypothetical protein